MNCNKEERLLDLYSYDIIRTDPDRIKINCDCLHYLKLEKTHRVRRGPGNFRCTLTENLTIRFFPDFSYATKELVRGIGSSQTF